MSGLFSQARISAHAIYQITLHGAAFICSLASIYLLLVICCCSLCAMICADRAFLFSPRWRPHPQKLLRLDPAIPLRKFATKSMLHHHRQSQIKSSSALQFCTMLRASAVFADRSNLLDTDHGIRA
jgi:hypothetical protein